MYNFFFKFGAWSVIRRICITDCYNGTGDDTVDDGRDDTVNHGRDDTVDDASNDTVDEKTCFQDEEYKITDSVFETNQVLKRCIVK